MPRKPKASEVSSRPSSPSRPPESKGELGKRLNAMQRVADSFERWKPAGQVLSRVRALPTVFPLVDRATKAGGWPIERVALVHGPSNHGKTAFLAGLGLSFLRSGNFFGFIDAEFATPMEWLAELMGSFAGYPGFVAMRPRTYEEAVDGVRELVEKVSKARDAGDLPPETVALVGVDSVRKLIPKNLLAKMLKKGASGTDGSIDGAGGRAGQIKAALNAQWLDELVPLLYYGHAGIVFVSREYEAEIEVAKVKGGKVEDAGISQSFKVGGGKALIFESSLVCRITRSWVKDGSGQDAAMVGERHTVRITKTKIGGKEGRHSDGYFHTSNGVLVPPGFDTARDVLELARDAGIVETRGSWLHWKAAGEKWQGESNAIRALHADRALLDTLEGEARA